MQNYEKLPALQRGCAVGRIALEILNRAPKLYGGIGDLGEAHMTGTLITDIGYWKQQSTAETHPTRFSREFRTKILFPKKIFTASSPSLRDADQFSGRAIRQIAYTPAA